MKLKDKPNQTSTSNPYTALLEEESEDKQRQTSPETRHVNYVKNISPLIQLLEQIVKQQYASA
jgi:hypothetical protein